MLDARARANSPAGSITVIVTQRLHYRMLQRADRPLTTALATEAEQARKGDTETQIQTGRSTGAGASTAIRDMLILPRVPKLKIRARARAYTLLARHSPASCVTQHSIARSVRGRLKGTRGTAHGLASTPPSCDDVLCLRGPMPLVAGNSMVSAGSNGPTSLCSLASLSSARAKPSKPCNSGDATLAGAAHEHAATPGTYTDDEYPIFAPMPLSNEFGPRRAPIARAPPEGRLEGADPGAAPTTAAAPPRISSSRARRNAAAAALSDPGSAASGPT